MEDQQVVSLTAMSHSIANLETLNRQMGNSLVGIAAWWTTVQSELLEVINDISDAASDGNNLDWSDIGMDISTAVEDWNDLETFANNMRSMAVGGGVQTHRGSS